MEEMNSNTTFLFNLPTEITGEIIQYLALSDRKNLRLTCKWLYELCNSDRFCREEKIKWSEDLIHHLNMESDLFRIGRSHYNLTIEDKTMEKSSILPFFEKLGTRIRSIDILQCRLQPGSLESIIMLCEGLTSLCLDFHASLNFLPDYFTFEPLLITRPQVTSLEVTLPPKKPCDYFHQIFSIFPNVKRLQINAYLYKHYKEFYSHLAYISTEEWLSVFHEIMNLGCNLEYLELSSLESQLLISQSEFFEAFPHLKQLTISFSSCSTRAIYTGIEKWYPCCSNLESVDLRWLKNFDPPEMIRLLTNTRLKSLSIISRSLFFNEESFRKLVVSRLATISISALTVISDLPMTIPDSLIEVNNTVKYLYLGSDQCPESMEMLFLKYFRGLVHLSLPFATDSILQCIFECQENLRSLKIRGCKACSINGFCGSNDGGNLTYSINNLQKLEHLTLSEVRLGIFSSDYFKRAFSFPRLKYLCLNLKRYQEPEDCTQTPIDLFKDSTELRAVRLSDAVLPSNDTLSSLFSDRKNLKYLRYDLENSSRGVVNSMTYIKQNCEYFSMTTKRCERESRLGHAYYKKDLDRMVILNEALQQTFHCQETRTFEIYWIKV